MINVAQLDFKTKASDFATKDKEVKDKGTMVEEESSFNKIFSEKKKSFSKEIVENDEEDFEIDLVSQNIAQVINLLDTPEVMELLPLELVEKIEEVLLPIGNLLMEVNLEGKNKNFDSEKLIEFNSTLKELISALEPIEENFLLKEILPKLKSEEEVMAAVIPKLQEKVAEKTNDNILNTVTREVNIVENQEELKPITLEGNNQGFMEEESSTLKKEEAILSSIINDKEEEIPTVTSKFSLTSEEVTTKSTEKVETPKVINKTEVAEDVVKTIKYMNANDVKELIVKVNPKELGEIAIKLIEQEGIIKASIKASSKETYSLLSQNLEEMKKHLQQQGIKIQNVDISLYEDTTFFKEEFNGNFFSRQGNENEKNLDETVEIKEDNPKERIEDEILDSNINMLA